MKTLFGQGKHIYGKVLDFKLESDKKLITSLEKTINKVKSNEGEKIEPSCLKCTTS